MFCCILLGLYYCIIYHCVIFPLGPGAVSTGNDTWTRTPRGGTKDRSLFAFFFLVWSDAHLVHGFLHAFGATVPDFFRSCLCELFTIGIVSDTQRLTGLDHKAYSEPQKAAGVQRGASGCHPALVEKRQEICLSLGLMVVVMVVRSLSPVPRGRGPPSPDVVRTGTTRVPKLRAQRARAGRLELWRRLFAWHLFGFSPVYFIFDVPFSTQDFAGGVCVCSPHGRRVRV